MSSPVTSSPASTMSAVDMPCLPRCSLSAKALGRGIAQPKPDLRGRIERAVGEIAARLGPGTGRERRFEEFRRQFHHLVEGLAPLVAGFLLARDGGQGKPGLAREPLDRLGEAEPLGHHHEIEDVAVLARREVEPHRLLVIDEKRRRLFLIEGREPPPLAARLLEPHAAADDLRNQKAFAQLIEELGRKAHAAGPADSLDLPV